MFLFSNVLFDGLILFNSRNDCRVFKSANEHLCIVNHPTIQKFEMNRTSRCRDLIGSKTVGNL